MNSSKGAGDTFTAAANSLTADHTLQQILVADSIQEGNRRFMMVAGIAVLGLVVVGIGYELTKK